jgi:hypothetical protein
VQIPGPEESDEPVAQILPLQQHEDHQHEDDGEGRNRRKNRREDALDELERRGARLMHLHWDRLVLALV